MRLKSALSLLLVCVSEPAYTLNLEAISRGIQQASPWGENAEFLPWLLAWFGFVVLLAVISKLFYDRFYAWRRHRRLQQTARIDAEVWLLDVGKMLEVPPPKGLKKGATPALWRRYRMAVKQALRDELVAKGA